MITRSEAPAPEKIEVKKHRRDLYDLSAATVEIGLTEVTRASVTPEKRIPKRKEYIKSLDLYPLRKYPIPNQDKKYGTQ